MNVTNIHPLNKKLRLGVTDGLERTQKCQSALARWLVGWIFALTHHGLFDYYQNSDCVQRQNGSFTVVALRGSPVRRGQSLTL